MILKTPLLERPASALVRHLVAKVHHVHDPIIAIVDVNGLGIAAIKRLCPKRARLIGQSLHVRAPTEPLKDRAQETRCKLLVATEHLFATDNPVGLRGGNGVRKWDFLARELLA